MNKGSETRNLIIKNTEVLFAQKGYIAVTMTDVCVACELSRGGLYRYFSSTKEIFIAILDNNINSNKNLLERLINDKTSAKDILMGYFLQEKQAILNPNGKFHFAVQEFAFREEDQLVYFQKRLEDSVNILKKIFEYGQITNEFKKFDIEAVAIHLIYFFLSLKTLSPIILMSEEVVEKQIALTKELIYENNSI